MPGLFAVLKKCSGVPVNYFVAMGLLPGRIEGRTTVRLGREATR